MIEEELVKVIQNSPLYICTGKHLEEIDETWQNTYEQAQLLAQAIMDKWGGE